MIVCIDLFLTNWAKYFENTNIETGLSNFHKMAINVRQIYYKKQK